MKNGKCLTKAQKLFLNEHHLNPGNWLISKNTSTEMVLVHRYTNNTRRILKPGKGCAE